jgi:hypothetical protein
MRTKNQPNTKRVHYLLKIVLIVIFYFACNSYLRAQENNFSKIVQAFQDYSKAYREVVYCHLNKSTYIKGESIGFSAYVFNKDLKKPSKTTKNLYCVILDSANNVVKSKLLKVNKGFSNNIFNLDSLFTSGNYTFKAYTNWMKNFDEPNIFIEAFTVIDPMLESSVVKKEIENELDVQFLPEGGHLVDQLRTNVGVVIKNKKGFGVPNVKGRIFDTNNIFISEFTTNSLGISRFPLYAEKQKKYLVKINHLNKSFEYFLDNVENKGIILNVSKLKDNLMLEFKTNEQTLVDVFKEPYTLLNQNGKEYKVLSVQFDKEDLVMSIQNKDLFPGINIFTLFNEENEPVLERMFFNYKGINFYNLKAPVYSKLGDSLRVSISLEDPRQFAYHEDMNVSISILPEGTKSYDRHQNLVSYTYLQPYVNGYIENAAYYFTNISSKKEYELDNLLITQGWSCYNWNDIFDNKAISEFVFEDGIVVKVNTNSSKTKNLIIYPLMDNQGYFVDLLDGEQSFLKEGFYPQDNETLNLGVLNNKGEANKVNLYVQYSPSRIPDFRKSYFQPLTINNRYYTKSLTKPFSIVDLNKAQDLDAVVIKVNSRQSRIEQIKASASLKVDVFDDRKRSINLTLPNYINSYMNGFSAIEQNGVLTILNRNIQSFSENSASPLIYLDDVLLNNTEFLINFDMSRVDYIAYDRHGFGEGMRGSGGVIKIYTSNTFSTNKNHESFRQFKFPLTFSENKKFYTPKYNVYDNEFFKEYGVIDWIPNCKLDEKGNLNFTISNLGNNNINFFIEGVSQSGTYFLDTKRLTIRE